MTTFRISEADLAGALGPAALFASTDKMLPIINAVQLTVHEDRVAFLATDRFTAALAKIPGAEIETVDGAQVLLAASDVKQILATFKRLPIGTLIQFDIEPDRIVVSVPDGAALTIRPLIGDFPRVGNLFANALSSTDGGFSAQRFDPKYLERVAKAAKPIKPEPGTLTTVVELRGADAKKPSLFAVGEHVLVLVMPVGRTDTDQERLAVFDSWCTDLNVTRKAAVA